MRKFNNRFLLILTLLIILSSANAQRIDSLIQEYIVNKNTWAKYLILSDTLSDNTLIIDKTSFYFKNISEDIRYRSYSLVFDALEKERKEKQLGFLLETIYSDKSYVNREAFGKRLHNFSRLTYDKDHIKILRKILYSDDLVNPSIIVTAGYLDMKEDKERIESFKDKRDAWPSRFDSQWASYLALARMGESEYIDSVMNYIYKASDFDNIIKNLRYLTYIQQDKATNFIIDLMMSDGQLPPVHPGKGEAYAYRPAKVLSSLLKDTPQMVYRRGKNVKQPDHLEIMRQWIKSQNGKWKYNRDNFW